MSASRPWFKSILVSVTEGCGVGCGHCGFIGSTRERESDAHELASWVCELCDYGIGTIIFTGGEPFERFEVLERGVAEATARGTKSAVFTSSYWATSEAAAKSHVDRLEGLDHFYLSSDVYHQKRIPYQNVWNVIEAAVDRGIPKISIVITYANDADLQEVKGQYQKHSSRVRFVEERVIPTPFIIKRLNDQGPLIPADEDDYQTHCWLDTPIVNPNGDVFACHVGKAGAHGDLSELPYWLGNLRNDRFAILMERAAVRADYQYLRTHGPKGVAQLYQLYPEIAREAGRQGFTGPCDMCFSALSHPVGRDALFDHVAKPEVLTDINLRLVLSLGEAPIDPDQVQVGPTGAEQDLSTT